MKTKIITHLTKNLIFTFFISCVLTALSIFIFYNNRLGSLEGNSGFLLFIIGGCISSLVLTVLSTTVYLNIYDKIRSDNIYSLLTFFLLPGLFTLGIFISNIDSDIWSLYLILTLPYILIQIYFYLYFKKTMTKF